MPFCKPYPYSWAWILSFSYVSTISSKQILIDWLFYVRHHADIFYQAHIFLCPTQGQPRFVELLSSIALSETDSVVENDFKCK